MFKSRDGKGELCHGVKIAWASVDKLFYEVRDLGARSPLGRKVADLLLAWDIASQKKPEETYILSITSFGQALLKHRTFRQRLLSSRGFRQNLPAFRYRLATKSNALFRIKNGALPDQ